jgi:hypothetical protein
MTAIMGGGSCYSVLKALMRIQHEIAKIHGQKQAKESVSDASDGIWQLLGYVDVVCSHERPR